MSLETELHELASAIRRYTDLAFPRPPKPLPFTVKLISERRINDMDFLTYEATLPPVLPNTDVTNQVFTVSVDGVAVGNPQELDATALTATFEVQQGANVLVSLRYRDEAGNLSEPQEQSFVAVDTIAPDAPGPFGEIRLISERTE